MVFILLVSILSPQNELTRVIYVQRNKLIVYVILAILEGHV